MLSVYGLEKAIEELHEKAGSVQDTTKKQPGLLMGRKVGR